MPITPYSPCPGGVNEKIRFCCPRLLGDLQEIERMLEGEQYHACLRHVEYLEKSNPDRACILAMKVLVLRLLDRHEEAAATAAVFLQKHPNNPLALAESAVAAALRDESRAAVELILQAVRASTDGSGLRVQQAVDSVARLLASLGHVAAARALGTMHWNFNRNSRRATEFLVEINSATTVPLVLKDDDRLGPCPPGAPWKAEFEEVLALVRDARWPQAEERLAALAERVDGEPALWSSLATIRGWLADPPGTIHALRRYAALDVPLEDAVEAEARAMFLSDDPLGDQQDVLFLRYTVTDVERLQAALASSRRASQVPIDPALLAGGDSPPPKALVRVFDRDWPEPGTQLTADTTPRLVCQGLLYGRQTDREARLEVSDLLASAADSVKTLLAETASDALAGEPQQEPIGKLSYSQHLLNCQWHLPAGIGRQRVADLAAQYLDRVLLETWAQTPLGVLDGKCPQEAAADPAYRTRTLAAILVLEFWLEQLGSRFDFNRLRTRLGLPALEPIDLEGARPEDVPLSRLGRANCERLSDDFLTRAFRRAMSSGAVTATRRFAQAVAERSSLGGSNERLLALEMMSAVAEDPSQATRYVEEGRNLTLAQGASCARWDLAELPLRVEQGDGDTALRLIEHLRTRHANEPGVRRALAEFLVRAGILHPDGSPVAYSEAAEQPSLVIPGQAEAKPGELWTPESQRPVGDKPKIWTPDAQ